MNDITMISSPEEINMLKRDEIFVYYCKECGKLNVVKFPGHHRFDRVEKLKKMLCKDCSQKLSKTESQKDKENAIEVFTVEDIEKLPRDTWFKFKCRFCGKMATVKYQGKSRMYLHSRFLCKRCSFNSTFDVEKSKETYRSKTGYDFALQNPSVREKGKETQREKHNGLLFSQTPEFREYMSNQNKEHPEWHELGLSNQIDRYGTYYLATEDCRKQLNKTMNEIHGVDYYPQSKEYSNKMQDMYGLDRSRPNKFYFSTSQFQEERKKKLNSGEWKIGRPSKYFFETDEFKKMREENKDNLNWRPKSSTTGKYNYEDLVMFDSGWELCLWIYAVDHEENIEREPEKFEYEFDGKIHLYSPDFKYNGKLIEIKGPQYFLNHDPKQRMIFPYTRLHSDSELLTEEEKKYMDDLYEAKHQCGLSNGVEFWSKEECLPYVEYVENIYGKDYISKFKINTEK